MKVNRINMLIVINSTCKSCLDSGVFILEAINSFDDLKNYLSLKPRFLHSCLFYAYFQFFIVPTNIQY
jgi:hypothetical protein